MVHLGIRMRWSVAEQKSGGAPETLGKAVRAMDVGDWTTVAWDVCIWFFAFLCVFYAVRVVLRLPFARAFSAAATHAPRASFQRLR